MLILRPMRKTNHVLHGVLTLLTVGVWGIGWGAITLRNWSYNESHGFNDPQHDGKTSDSRPHIRYSTRGSSGVVSIMIVDDINETVAQRIATQQSRPLSELVRELDLDSPVTAAPRIATGPATFLPRAPAKKKERVTDEVKREFELDKELTEMFEEMGVHDPADMQKIIDAALADTSTALPRNRLLLSFGNYARKLIQDNDLQIP